MYIMTLTRKFVSLPLNVAMTILLLPIKLHRFLTTLVICLISTSGPLETETLHLPHFTNKHIFLQNGRAEITTEDAVTALKKAAKWAQMGLVVSTGPPVDNTPQEAPTGDKKKVSAEAVCREKNNDLAR